MEPIERVIVAADFIPENYEDGVDGAVRAYRALTDALANTGATVKGNSLIRHLGGGTEVQRLRELGNEVMVDYKLDDIPNTMETDAQFLAESEPKIVTVMCSSGVDGMARVQAALPHTIVAGVTVLTTFTDETCKRSYGQETALEGVLHFAEMAVEAGLRGLVCSPHEANAVKREYGDTLLCITPAIRPEWSIVKRDDQKRVMTVVGAFNEGADLIVVGRPIVQAESPMDAFCRTVEEVPRYV